MHIPLLEKQSVVPRLFARHVSTCYYTTFFFELLKISKANPPFFQPRQTDSELSLQCDIPAALFALHQKEQTVVITGLCNLLLDFLHRFHRMAIHL